MTTELRLKGMFGTSAWITAIDQWVEWLRAGGLRRATIELRRSQMFRFARTFKRVSPWDVSADQVTSWISAHDWKRETIRSHRAALRSFYGWAVLDGHVQQNPTRLLRPVKPGEINPRPAGDRVIRDAMASAEPRVALMIELGSRHGLRRGEICQVHTRDLIADGDDWSLTVHGKGGREREVPLLAATAERLRAVPFGWVFPSSGGGHLTPAHCGKLVRRQLTAAAGQRTTCHQLRHRYAAVTWKASRDLASVQDLLGHASPVTTRAYVGGDKALRRLVAQAAGA